MSSMAKPWKHPDSGIYYHRIEVPSDIRDIISKRWIKNSLKTRNFSEAKRLFALQYAETQALFAQARDRVSLTPKDIEILSQRWFEQALSEIEDEGVTDRYIVRYEGEEYQTIDMLVSDALERGYPQQLRWVKGFVTDVLTENNLLLTEGSDDYKKLTEKLCWRFLELSKIALDRFYDDWSSTGDRFTSRAGETLSTEKGRKVAKTPVILDYKPLSEVVGTFIKFKTDRGDWEQKTHDDALGVCTQLIEYLGPNTDPSSITREQLRDFSVLLAQLPKNYTRTPRFKGLSLHQLTEIAADEELPTAASGTVRKKFVFIKSLFKHAEQEEWVDRDRAKGITIPKGVTSKRVAYKSEELEVILKATAKSDRKSDYWMPRIALTTGMRSNEILQLTTGDVKQLAGVWCFDVNIEGDKKTKNTNSERVVPIPEILIELGLLDYVQGLEAGQLFPCVQLGSDGTYSQTFSKRFAVLRDRLGLKPDPDEMILRDFHSFRHNFRANSRAFGMPKEIADLIGGWRDQDGRTAGDDYGVHFESFIGELKFALDGIEYPDAHFRC